MKLKQAAPGFGGSLSFFCDFNWSALFKFG